MLKQLQSPIIIVQDSNYGNISTTTNDVLNQVELLRYSTNLKGVDLDQFMQMTDERDFKLYGIRKQRDCQKLSKIAQSIRRSSMTSSLSSFSQSDDDDNIVDEESTFLTPNFAQQQGTHDNDIPYLALNDNEDKVDDLKIVEGVLQKIQSIAAAAAAAAAEETATASDNDENEKIWPNSINDSKQKTVRTVADPPKYDSSRHSSLPSLMPPEYCEFNLDKRRRNSYAMGDTTSNKRSNSQNITMEEKETLPIYSCTVHKMGKASVKIEFDSPGVRPKRRPWRDVYMELQGTVLKIYEAKSISPPLGGYRYLPTMAPFYQESNRYVPLVNISLSNAKLELANDYIKKSNVFRIKTESGPQILFHVQTSAAVLLWTEKISAGINIAVDLECQRMPKFTTTVAFEDHPNETTSNSATHQSYRALVMEERQRKELESEDALI